MATANPTCSNIDIAIILQGHMQSVIWVFLWTHQFHLRGLIGNHHSETQECDDPA